MAKKKSKLFKSKAEIKKTMQQSILESVAAAGGGVATSFAYTAVKDKIPEKFQKYGGVLLVGAGTGLNVYAKDPVLKAVSHGIATAGGLHGINELAPDNLKTKVGLSLQGLGNANPDNTDKISDEELRQIEAEMSQQFDEDNKKNQSSENSDEASGLNEEDDF